AWPLVRAAAVPAAIVLLALLLRVFRLELHAWTPDTYEQLTAGRRLVAGEFPISVFYPPGVAITLAPAFLFFPQTLATQQGVIIGSSVVLVAVAYFAMRSATKDRIAPALLAAGIALAPQSVYFSRDGMFDMINTAWIVSAILVVPWLRGRPLLVFAAYGTLLAVAMNIRATNPAFLPALVIYWTDIGRVGFDRRAIRSALACRPIAVAGAAMLASYALLAYAGGSLGHAASHAPVTFAHAGENTAFYARAQLGDVLSAPLIVVLAALGSTYLWSRNRSLLFVSIYMLTIFPLAHVPLPFANNRYMLPSLVFALLLAAHAPAAVISMTARQPALVRNTWRAMAVSVVLLLGFYYVAADAYMVWYWPRGAARSDEAGYRQLRPTIATLPAGSLLVSGGTRGVRDSNAGIEYLDLIDYSLATDNGPERVDPIMQRIQSALDEGRPVYYLYTSVEGINITFAQSGPGYQPYFDAASQRFRLAEVRATSLKFFTLYKIEGPR
ncbi:MAG: hypothetical protein AAB349_00395, partial [Chloroflexota bacterium]